MSEIIICPESLPETAMRRNSIFYLDKIASNNIINKIKKY
jgi:hypothetical protein